MISGALPEPNAQCTSTSSRFSTANTIATTARTNIVPARTSSDLSPDTTPPAFRWASFGDLGAGGADIRVCC